MVHVHDLIEAAIETEMETPVERKKKGRAGEGAREVERYI